MLFSCFINSSCFMFINSSNLRPGLVPFPEHLSEVLVHLQAGCGRVPWIAPKLNLAQSLPYAYLK